MVAFYVTGEQRNRDVVILCLGEYRGRLKVKDIMRYVVARVKEKWHDEAYRVYISDSLRMITHADMRYADMVGITNRAKDTRTADEVISSVKGRLSKLGE